MRSRPFLCAALAATLLVGCAADVDVKAQQDGLGTSRLAPDLEPKRDRTKPEQVRSKAAKKPRRRPASQPAGSAASTPAPRPAAATTPAGPVTSRAVVGDPTGDVRGLTGAPAYADLTGASLMRASDGFTLHVSFAGAVPHRQGSDGEVVNVATFVDLDGDGQVDYEVWATLADDGWGSSYRTPSGARFGDDSGVRVRPEGSGLVLSFPLAHLERARLFRWAVGAEHGSVEQVASGTTARDNAPDAGVAAFPG
jgi:hypothetical protein